MAFSSGTADVGETPVPLCPVSETGAVIRNGGDVRVYLGGPDVGNDGTADGYPLEPGEAETFTGAQHRPSGVVPAPPGDADDDVLYARTAPGDGPVPVSWISSGG
jgi:hypothetical protein